MTNFGNSLGATPYTCAGTTLCKPVTAAQRAVFTSLQQALNKVLALTEAKPITVDGLIGAGTVAAVRATADLANQYEVAPALALMFDATAPSIAANAAGVIAGLRLLSDHVGEVIEVSGTAPPEEIDMGGEDVSRPALAKVKGPSHAALIAGALLVAGTGVYVYRRRRRR
jgi:LPXTG-motif cell wall-anchored protein